MRNENYPDDVQKTIYMKYIYDAYMYTHENDFQTNRAATGLFLNNKCVKLVVDTHYYGTRNHRNTLFQQSHVHCFHHCAHKPTKSFKLTGTSAFIHIHRRQNTTTGNDVIFEDVRNDRIMDYARLESANT